MQDFHLVEPNEERITLACQQFDDENKVVEDALGVLLQVCSANTVQAHVLLKVVAVNRLYWTNILDVHGMAHRIWEVGAKVDEALSSGKPEIVDRIAKFGRKRIEYSFASKYCSWHRHNAYPIWDSRVRRYLLALRRSTQLEFLGKNAYLWNEYPEFVKIMSGFREHFGLSHIGFKSIDKFLYVHGKEQD